VSGTMISKKLNNIKTWADAQLSKYFPAVRGAVLLIVIPAFFIVIIYFISILTEIIKDEEYRSVVDYEARLAAIKQDLPPNAVVNYVSNSEAPDDLINAEYVLIPIRIVAGLQPEHDLLVFHNFNTTELPEFDGYALKKNYGNNVILFKRNK
jgi:hypothetical protein